MRLDRIENEYFGGEGEKWERVCICMPRDLGRQATKQSMTTVDLIA